MFAIIVTMIFIIARGKFRQEFLQMGKIGWVVVFTYVISTPAFIAAFKSTTVANVALIYAAVPFFATVLAWIFISERPSKSVIIAGLMAFAGVGIIVGDSIGQLNLKGDLLALWMTIIMAVIIILYRRYPDTPAAGPNVLGSFFLLIIAALVSDPLSAELSEIPYMAGFGLVFALASITLVVGARYLPAAQTALCSALEAPLAPLWAWLILTEAPSTRTFIGGSIILIAVYANNKASSMKQVSSVCETENAR